MQRYRELAERLQADNEWQAQEIARLRAALQEIADSKPQAGSSRLWVEKVHDIAAKALKGE